MSEAKHLQGPWRVGLPSVMYGVQIFKDSDAPLRSVAICTMPSKGKGRTAHARLIAAAPNLFKACKDITVWLKNTDNVKLNPAIYKQLISAIAITENKS